MNWVRWARPISERSKTFLNLLAKGYFSKAKNYLLTNINMLRRPEYATNYPITLIIDPGNICNLSCALCITGQKKSLRPPKLLSFNHFKKIIDELGKRAVKLDLYNWGEPFLNKDIFKMISYAKRAGLRVELSSNLNIFNQAMAKELVDSKLDKLIISLHGTNKKTYNKYMRGGDFDQVVENIKLLVKTKKRLKSHLPEIAWRFLVSRYSEAQLEKAESLSQKLGIDHLEPVPLKLDVGFDPDEIKERIKKNAHWIPGNKKYCLYDAQKEAPINKEGDCFWPWEIVSINPDGAVQPCCVFTNPAFDFGNIFKTPFREIWNGKKYQAARKIVREKIKTDKSTICGLCVATDFMAR